MHPVSLGSEREPEKTGIVDIEQYRVVSAVCGGLSVCLDGWIFRIDGLHHDKLVECVRTYVGIVYIYTIARSF